MRKPETDCPPVVGATEGQSIAMGANATAPYRKDDGGGKAPPHSAEVAHFPRALPAESADCATSIAHARAKARETVSRGKSSVATFRASTGRIWAFDGKRAGTDGTLLIHPNNSEAATFLAPEKP